MLAVRVHAAQSRFEGRDVHRIGSPVGAKDRNRPFDPLRAFKGTVLIGMNHISERADVRAERIASQPSRLIEQSL